MLRASDQTVPQVFPDRPLPVDDKVANQWGRRDLQQLVLSLMPFGLRRR